MHELKSTDRPPARASHPVLLLFLYLCIIARSLWKKASNTTPNASIYLLFPSLPSHNIFCLCYKRRNLAQRWSEIAFLKSCFELASIISDACSSPPKITHTQETEQREKGKRKSISPTEAFHFRPSLQSVRTCAGAVL